MRKSLLPWLVSRVPARLARPALARARAPRLALARRTWRRLGTSDLRLPPPTSVILEPTLRCQQACDFCFQRRPEPGDMELSLQSWEQLLTRLAPRRLKLIGGEVLLREDAARLIHVASQQSRELLLTSNGLGLNEPLTLALTRLPNLSRLSLSRCPGPHGPAGHLARLAPYTLRLSRRTWLVAQLLVEPGGGPDLARAVARLPEAGMRWALLMQRMGATADEVEQTRRLLAAELGWRGDWPLHVAVSEVPPAPMAQLDQAMALVHDAARQAGVTAVEEVGLTPDARTRFHLSQPGQAAACAYLLSPTLRLNPAGEVIFCEHLRHPLGDLRRHPLDRIWSGETMRALRWRLRHQGPLPVCNRCCKLKHLG